MKEWLPAGTVIAHFQVSSRISANGIGEVYQAIDVSSGLELALKLLPASLIDDPQTRSRFIQTSFSITQMRDHNFCRVYEAGITEDGRPFVAMEYVKVFSLGAVFYELLTGRQPFSGPSAPELVAAATLTAPPPITDFREDASPALNEAVMKALAHGWESSDVALIQNFR